MSDVGGGSPTHSGGLDAPESYSRFYTLPVLYEYVRIAANLISIQTSTTTRNFKRPISTMRAGHAERLVGGIMKGKTS